MNQDFWNIWLKSPTMLTENVENQMKMFKEFQPQNQVQVSAVNDYVKDQMDLAGKLQKDLTNIVKNNPLDAVSVMQLVTAYNQTVFANNMLFLNNIFKKN